MAIYGPTYCIVSAVQHLEGSCVPGEDGGEKVFAVRFH